MPLRDLLRRYFTDATVTPADVITSHLIPPSSHSLYCLEDIADETAIISETGEVNLVVGLGVSISASAYFNSVSVQSERSRVAMVHYTLAKLFEKMKTIKLSLECRVQPKKIKDTEWTL